MEDDAVNNVEIAECISCDYIVSLYDIFTGAVVVKTLDFLLSHI